MTYYNIHIRLIWNEKQKIGWQESKVLNYYLKLTILPSKKMIADCSGLEGDLLNQLKYDLMMMNFKFKPHSYSNINKESTEIFFESLTCDGQGFIEIRKLTPMKEETK